MTKDHGRSLVPFARGQRWESLDEYVLCSYVNGTRLGIHNHTYISPSKRCSNPGYNLVRMRTQSGSQTSSFFFECIRYFGHLTARSGPSSGKKKRKKKMASTVRPGRLVMLNSGSRVHTRRRKSGFHAMSRDCVLIRWGGFFTKSCL